jgi:hypothetical protein
VETSIGLQKHDGRRRTDSCPSSKAQEHTAGQHSFVASILLPSPVRESRLPLCRDEIGWRLHFHRFYVFRILRGCLCESCLCPLQVTFLIQDEPADVQIPSAPEWSHSMNSTTRQPCRVDPLSSGVQPRKRDLRLGQQVTSQTIPGGTPRSGRFRAALTNGLGTRIAGNPRR